MQAQTGSGPPSSSEIEIELLLPNGERRELTHEPVYRSEDICGQAYKRADAVISVDDGRTDAFDGQWSYACSESALAFDMDDRLPIGRSAREVLARVASIQSSAYAWNSALALSDLEPPRLDMIAQPEEADREVSVDVEVRYTGPERLPFELGGCSSQRSALELPVELSLRTSDGQLDLELRGVLVSEGQELIVMLDEDQMIPGRELGGMCDFSSLYFTREGLPRGDVCSDDGTIYRMPTACSGDAQAPLDEQLTAELPVPSAAVAEVESTRSLEIEWSDDERQSIELSIERGSDLACHRLGHSWTAPLAIGVELPDDAVRFSVPGALRYERLHGSEPFTLVEGGCGEVTGAALDMFAQRAGEQLTSARICVALGQNAEVPGAAASIELLRIAEDEDHYEILAVWPVR